MTLREAQALIILFQACQDVSVRQRALALVPDLRDWDRGQKDEDRASRWLMTARVDSLTIGAKPVVCREADLPEHVRLFRDGFDLATNVVVTTERLP